MKLSLENTSEANQSSPQQMLPGQASGFSMRLKNIAVELGAWLIAVVFILITAQVLAFVF